MRANCCTSLVSTLYWLLFLSGTIQYQIINVTECNYLLIKYHYYAMLSIDRGEDSAKLFPPFHLPPFVMAGSPPDLDLANFF